MYSETLLFRQQKLLHTAAELVYFPSEIEIMFNSETALRWRNKLQIALGKFQNQDFPRNEIKAILFEADLSSTMVERFLHRLDQGKPKTQEQAVTLLVKEAQLMAQSVFMPEKIPRAPYAILLVGVNGSGKTTVAARLAKRIMSGGQKVTLAAADTFRAGAIEQLQYWGEKTGAEVVVQKPGADPAAVAFDGWQRALSANTVLIVDTAGRLHTKTPLMEQLKKTVRVLGKDGKGAPHESFLVLDGTTGQNTLTQSREFTKAISLTGLIVTKLDGSARGGAALSSSLELSLSIRYVGIGEKENDLIPFDPMKFAQDLFGI